MGPDCCDERGFVEQLVRRVERSDRGHGEEDFGEVRRGAAAGALA